MKADLANTALEPNAYKQLHDENLGKIIILS